jgi:hypothetical protein
MGPYKHLNVALERSQKDGEWKRFFMTDTMIIKFNDKYYLYYVSNSFDKPATPQNKRWYQCNCTQKAGVAIANKIEDFVTGKFIMPEKWIMGPERNSGNVRARLKPPK